MRSLLCCAIERSFGPEFGTESTRRSSTRRSSTRRTRPRVVVLRNLRRKKEEEMPSVEMRRTTRVFGMGKGVDGARVLRSGRRLWPESSVVKLDRTNVDDDDTDWIKLIKNNQGQGRGHFDSDKPHKGWTRAGPKPKPNVLVSMSRVVEKPAETKEVVSAEFKRFGIVYTRKRKGSGDKMYGQRFARKKRRTTPSPQVLHIMFDSSWCRRYLAARFLYSILVYMSRSSLQLTELSQFLGSEPISIVFALPGINFSWVHSADIGSGICKFFGSREFTPTFSVDFSAVPLCFMNMHSKMHFRYIFRPIVPVNYLNDRGVDDDDDVDQCVNDSDEHLVLREVHHTDSRPLHPHVKVPKLGCRGTLYRNGLSSQDGIQKRRSSLRRTRSRNPSFVAIRRHNGALVSELMNFKKNGLSFSSVASSQKLRRSDSTCSATSLKAVSSNPNRLQDLDLTCCVANLLVTESDRCYREVGVTIMLETSSSGEWLLVAKKDGLVRLTHKAEKEKVIRPGSNRFTHDIIWSPDSDVLRLEFPDRSEWVTFKELYKECSDRNATIEFIPQPASDRNATAKSIPVPVVREVPDYADQGSSFLMPESYISMKEDELSRSFARKTANYDMDSEDEEWLKKFNLNFELHDHVSEDKFESMVDAFEKALYSIPYDLSDGTAAASHFLDMGKRDVVEPVYSYWLNRRKQKRSSLLRVFQGHQVKRSLLDSKPVMRKRRSFKRQPSQFGRGKQPSFLQAMAAEQDAFQEQTAMLKVEEAKSAADRSVDLAIRKRHRAQVLMQNADLATYKAAMAFRIAEAAQVLGSPDAAAVYVLD